MPSEFLNTQPANLICSWSGGKDSCYALYKASKEGHQLQVLFNMLNENGNISRSHGLPPSLLKQQADALGVPLHTWSSSWDTYEKDFIQNLKNLKNQYGATGVVFGDIDLELHQQWEEKVCQETDLKALLPLWQYNRKKLLLEMLDTGIEAIIVSCNTVLGTDFLGRKIDTSLITDLKALGIDVCGELGEYHTVVVNCPLFKNPIQLPKFSKTIHQDYCFLVWDTIDYSKYRA